MISDTSELNWPMSVAEWNDNLMGLQVNNSRVSHSSWIALVQWQCVSVDSIIWFILSRYYWLIYNPISSISLSMRGLKCDRSSHTESVSVPPDNPIISLKFMCSILFPLFQTTLWSMVGQNGRIFIRFSEAHDVKEGFSWCVGLWRSSR